MPNSHVLISWLKVVVHFHSTTWNPSEYRYIAIHNLTSSSSFLPPQQQQQQAKPTKHASLFFSLSLYPKSQLGNPLIISSSSFVHRGHPSEYSPKWQSLCVNSGEVGQIGRERERVKRPRPFFFVYPNRNFRLPQVHVIRCLALMGPEIIDEGMYRGACRSGPGRSLR